MERTCSTLIGNADSKAMSALPLKADISIPATHVCFVPETDIGASSVDICIPTVPYILINDGIELSNPV